ncbi:MAG: HEPN domain-containing protein [Patescibacteria group bacterium]|nr:HEPN domain-containing protein [Patescibacteria group bacterium]
MNLQDLLKNNQVEPINITVADARAQLDKAYKQYNFAKKNLSETGDEDMVYNHIYDSLRLACTAILYLNGYRVKTSGPGHHWMTVQAAGLVMNELPHEFERIEKMRKKRNILEYGKTLPISETDLKQGMSDAQTLLERVNTLIGERESKLPIT